MLAQLENTKTNTKVTTHKGTNIIDVQDCTVFCQQQWVTVAGETFSGHTSARIIRVIGLGHRLGQIEATQHGFQGKLVVELPADNGVTEMDVVISKGSLLAKITVT